MRIVSGKYKGRRFDVPGSFKARPTTDFAKENLFNILQAQDAFSDAPPALDLFAGTGSISLELLSRGCAPVVSVEMDRDHARFLHQTALALADPNWRVLRADVFRFLKTSKQLFPLIFADPPYALPSLPELPQRILQSGLLAPGGLLIVEHGKTNDFSSLPQFTSLRTYGSVHFSFFCNEQDLSQHTSQSGTVSPPVREQLR